MSGVALVSGSPIFAADTRRWRTRPNRRSQHARHAGRRADPVCACAGLVMGPRPADEALGALDEAVPDKPRPRKCCSAVLVAMLGRFDEAWTLAREANERLQALGAMGGRERLGQIAELAGDYEAAAEYFRQSCEWLEEHGHRACSQSWPRAWPLALWAQGRHEEAEPLAELGRGSAERGRCLASEWYGARPRRSLTQASGKHADGRTTCPRRSQSLNSPTGSTSKAMP